MLLERERELAALSESFEQVKQGRGRIVLIAGEAGIGKTSLLQEFIGQHPSDVVCWGVCDALFTPQALGPVCDISLGLSADLGKLASEGADSQKLFSSILSELHKPVARILVVEDLHWADHATLDFVKFIARRIIVLPVILILTYREEEFDHDHPLHLVLGELAARNVTRLPLQPLSVNAISALAANSAHSPTRIMEITGGNPFFVTELLEAHTDGSQAIPTSIRDTVNARLNRLTEAESAFIEFLSVIPGGIDPAIIDDCLDGAEDSINMAIDRNFLKRGGDGEIRFRHELARLAIYSRLSSSQIRKHHERILKRLLRACDPQFYSQIVHHAEGANQAKTLLEFAPLAARHAAQLGSHREAAAYFSAALKFIDEASPEQAALLYEGWAYEAGLALSISDEVIEARQHAITLWRALGRMNKVGENLRWLSRLFWYRGQSVKANHYANEAVRLLEDEGPSREKALAQSMRSQIYMLAGAMDDAIAWGEEALTTVEQLDAADIRAHALNNIGTAKIFRGDKSGVDDMNDSLEIALQHGLHEDAARVYTNLAEYAVQFRDFPLAERVLNEGIAFDSRHDLDSWTFYLTGRLAELRFEQGLFREAVNICETVLKRQEQTLLMCLPAKLVLSRTLLRTGDASAKVHLDEVLQDAMQVDEIQYIAPARIALLEYAWLIGDKDIAITQVNSLSQDLLGNVSDWVYADFIFWSLLNENSNQLSKSATPPKSAPRPYQLFFDGDLSAAAQSFLDLESPYMAAVFFLIEASAESLKKAYDLARQMGAHGMIEKIRVVSAQNGYDARPFKSARGPYRAARLHPLGLTKKEQTILKFIVEGANNQEIAEKLSRSKRTIENHITAIYAKLNAKNRVDVLVRAQSEPWLLDDGEDRA